MVLADLGAGVVKVERPGQGDDTRRWGPPFLDGMSAYFAAVNRNKRSITLDVALPEGYEVLERLVQHSDVVLENFLPETAAKLRLDANRLQTINPRAVVCSITGFGHTGPWRNQPGYDFVVQALSGLMSITGEPGGAPMKVGVALTDVLTGLYAAVGILASLVARDRLPPGGGAVAAWAPHLDVALLDCTLASLVNVAQSYLVTRTRPPRLGNAHPQIVPYQGFETADGHLVLAVGNDAQWQRFCAAAGRADLVADARFATNPSRVAQRDALVPVVAALLRTKSTTEWQQLLDAAEVPNAPVLGVDEAFALEQVAARQMLLDVPIGDPSAGQRLQLVGTPIKISGREPPPATPPPGLGEHTDAVLRELGYSANQIAALRERKVI
jgi:formyl-CoA transferase